jgi:hypothetical protein
MSVIRGERSNYSHAATVFIGLTAADPVAPNSTGPTVTDRDQHLRGRHVMFQRHAQGRGGVLHGVGHQLGDEQDDRVGRCVMSAP